MGTPAAHWVALYNIMLCFSKMTVVHQLLLYIYKHELTTLIQACVIVLGCCSLCTGGGGGGDNFKSEEVGHG